MPHPCVDCRQLIYGPAWQVRCMSCWRRNVAPSLAARRPVATPTSSATTSLAAYQQALNPVAQTGSRSLSLWDVAEEARLRQAYRAGQSVNQMATAHGRSGYAIQCRLEQMGLVRDRHEVPTVGPANRTLPTRHVAAPEEPYFESSGWRDDGDEYSDEYDEYDEEEEEETAPVPATQPDPDYLVSREAAAECTCAICHLVLHDAVLVTACGHKFCHHCATRMGASCAECRGPRTFIPDHALRRKVAGLVYGCDRDDDCTWTGKAAAQDGHTCKVPPRVKASATPLKTSALKKKSGKKLAKAVAKAKLAKAVAKAKLAKAVAKAKPAKVVAKAKLAKAVAKAKLAKAVAKAKLAKAVAKAKSVRTASAATKKVVVKKGALPKTKAVAATKAPAAKGQRATHKSKSTKRAAVTTQAPRAKEKVAAPKRPSAGKKTTKAAAKVTKVASEGRRPAGRR